MQTRPASIGPVRVQPRLPAPGLLALLMTCTLSLLLPGNLSAVGFRLPNQDPEAIARGDAFAATADNPSAIYYNPAGITQLEDWNLRLGIYAISPSVDFTSSSTGQKGSVNSDFQAVPQFYLTYSPTNLPLAFGLGLYAPYGLSADWGNNNPFRTVAESGDLVYLTINPVVAWKINQSLSVAIGPTINYSQATIKQGIAAPGDEFKFKGDGWAEGFNAGILWQPHPMWSFGVTYRYATDVDYHGTSYFHPYVPGSQPTSGTLHFPQFVVGGISFRPTTNWNFEFDLDWTDWNSVKTATFNGAAFPTVLTFDYTSGFIYDFGITRQLGKGYFVSTGYIYAENSSPDANFNPVDADSDLQLGSIGFGHHGQWFDWALAYHFGYDGGRTVVNDSPQNAPAEGTYKTFNNAFNAAVTFKF